MKTKSLIWIMAGVLLLYLCVSGVSATPPTASFTVSPSIEGYAPFDVAFTDTSSGNPPIYSWEWDFGDYSSHSFNQNPTHTYYAPGTYNVQLTVWNDDGSNSIFNSITVTENPSTGHLIVTSNPSGAIVYIDDIEQYNPTPFTYYGITPGNHEVQVARGYQSQTYSVTINAGQEIPLNFDLTDTPTFGSITPTNGPTAGGQSVTIQGWHFLDNAPWGGTPLKVTIGGATATVTGPTDGTFIYATTPSGIAGARDVVITNGGGGNSITGYSAYTYAVPTVHNIDSHKDFQTIQAAIDDSATVDGNTINVDSGTYPEYITVNKRLNIHGLDTGSGHPVVAMSYWSGQAISITNDYVTLDGFSVNNLIGPTGPSGASGTGVYISSSANTLSDIHVNYFEEGIYLDGASNNRIETCTGTGNRNGIHIYHNSQNNIVDTCTLTYIGTPHLSAYGVAIDGSSHNRVQHTTVSDMYRGISITKNDYWGTDSTDNRIQNNFLEYNDYNGYVNGVGIYLDGPSNTIDSNTITDNSVGIELSSNANSNTITNNYFSQGSNAVTNLLANTWNLASITPATPDTNILGDPNLGGNYWANPSSTGYSQTCTDANSDGICEIPYTIDASNIDNFPLKAVGSPAEPPVADFMYTLTFDNEYMDVAFFDDSTGGTPDTWEWDFNDDGIIDSTLPNPTHHYTTIGSYYVTLTVSNSGGDSSKTYLVAPTTAHIEVTSVPPGADIYLDGILVVEYDDDLEVPVYTPYTLDVNWESVHTVQVKLVGYQDSEIMSFGELFAGQTTNADFNLVPSPTVTSITPNVGSDTQSSWPVTIEGTDFVDGVILVYLKQGDDEIIAHSIDFVDSTHIECEFDLSDEAPGSYTVWVENSPGQEGFLTDGFTVVSESALTTAQYNPSTEVLYAGPQMNGGEEVKTSCLDFNVPDYAGQLFLKDPVPEANWEKPVTFYYVQTVQPDQTPIITEYPSCSPPTNIDMPLVDGHPWAPDGSGPAPVSLPATPPSQCTGGFAANRYALLISGGQDKTINYVRYYNDLSTVYDKLTNTYCYDPAKIYVLYSDGKTSGTDTLDYYGPPSTYTAHYKDTIWSAITDDADRTSLDSMLTSLKTGGSRALPSTAKLLIYVDNHGASTGDLKLWGSSASIKPSDFVSALPTQVDTIMMVMQQCYSGAFITPFTTATWSGGNQNQKRYIMTAATSSQYSYGNAFATAWISAITNGCPSMKNSFTDAANSDAAKASETPSDGARSGTDPTTVYLADSCAPASITVKTPNGGESWQQGTSYQYPITWSQTGLDSADTVKIELWTVGGGSAFKSITASTKATSGIFGVANIPATYTVGSSYLIKITCNQHSSATDTSNAAFSITAAGNKGSFTIKSTPVTGADVYIDGIKQSSPTNTAAISGIPVGVDHKVRIEKTNYYSPEGTYKLTTNGESQTITFKLIDSKNDLVPPFVTLAVDSVPPGALIRIQDIATGEIIDTGIKTFGTTPVYTDPLDPLAIKEYKVSVSLDGYQDPDPITVKVNKNWISDVPVNFNFIEKPKVPVKTLIVPNPLNLGRTGYFLALVKLPTGYKAADVKAESVYCEKAPALKVIRIKLFPQIFVAIFSRQDLGPYPTGNYNMNVKGIVMKNGAYDPFLGSDKVNIINMKVTTKEDVDSVMTMSDTQIFTKFNKL